MTVSLFVVEDTDHVRKMLLEILGLHGFEIAGEASGGEEALQRIDRADPDVVILDLRMPEMDGVMLLEVMRSYLRWHALPVVLLTAYPEDPRLAKTDELGVTSVMCKGNYKMTDLLALIDDLTASPSA